MRTASAPAGPVPLLTWRLSLRVVSAGEDFGVERVYVAARAVSLTIGSGPTCDLKIRGSDLTDSIHCTLRLHGRTHLAINHSTRRPLKLNSIEQKDHCPLHCGDLLNIGGCVLRYTLTSGRDPSVQARRQQEEKGLAALYENLKRLFRKLGIGRS